LISSAAEAASGTSRGTPGLTHAAEQGASTPMLMALSGHTSVRSLANYVRVCAEALGKWQAQRDPAARRTGGAR